MKKTLAACIAAWLTLMLYASANGPPPPSEPYYVRALHYYSSYVEIAWQSPPQAATYEIESKADNGEWKLATKFVASYNPSPFFCKTYAVGFTPGTYQFRIRATDPVAGSASPYSEVVSTVVPPFGVPANLQISVLASARMRVKWSDVYDDTGYELWRKVGGQWALFKTLPKDTISLMLTQLPAGEVYELKIRALSTASASEFSSSVTARTFRVLKPVSAQPRNVNGIDWMEVVFEGEVTGEDQLRSYLRLSSDLKTWRLADIGEMVVTHQPAQSGELTDSWVVRYRRISTSGFIKVVMPNADITLTK